MSITLERRGEDRSGLARVIRFSSIYESGETAGEGRRVRSLETVAAVEEEEAGASASTSTSSIGKNSESYESDREEEEVESKYKGALNKLESLEEALPMR